MRKIGIIQSRGLGDIIIALPIARYLHEQGCRVLWPIDQRFINSFQPAVDYVEFIPFPFSPTLDGFLTTPTRLLKEAGCEQIVPLYSSLTHGYTANATLAASLKFDEYKYAVAGVPFSEKWNLSIKRNPERERALFEKLVTQERYVVRQVVGSDFVASVPIPAPYASAPVITISEVTDNIFDWLMILEKASLLVMIDSCFANLVEQLGLNVPKIMVLRSPTAFTPVYKNGWTFASNPVIGQPPTGPNATAHRSSHLIPSKMNSCAKTIRNDPQRIRRPGAVTLQLATMRAPAEKSSSTTTLRSKATFGRHEIPLLRAQEAHLDAELTMRRELAAGLREVFGACDRLRDAMGTIDEFFAQYCREVAPVRNELEKVEANEKSRLADIAEFNEDESEEEILLARNLRKAEANQAHFILHDFHLPVLTGFTRILLHLGNARPALRPTIVPLLKTAQTRLANVTAKMPILGMRRISFDCTAPTPPELAGAKNAWAEFLKLQEANAYFKNLTPHEGKPGPLRIAYFAIGGLGDALLQTPLLERIRQKFAPCEIVFFHSRSLVSSLFAGNGSVDAAVYAPDPLLLRLIPACRHLGIFDLILESRFAVWGVLPTDSRIKEAEHLAWVQATQAYARTLLPYLERFPQYCNLFARIKRPHMLLDVHGESTRTDVTVNSPLHLACADADANFVESCGLHRKRFVTVHDGFDESFGKQMGISRCSKQLPAEQWSRLVSRLRSAGFTVVQVGGGNEPPIDGVDLDLRGKTSISQLSYILKAAVVHIDTEGGVVHVARAVHKRSIVAFGPTSVTFWGYPTNINLTSPDYADFWWINPDWMARSPLQNEPLPLECFQVDEIPKLVAKEWRDANARRFEIEALTSVSSADRNPAACEFLRELGAQAGVEFSTRDGELVNAALGIASSATRSEIYRRMWELISNDDREPKGLTVVEVECAGSPLVPILAGHKWTVAGFSSQFRSSSSAGDASDAARYYIEVNKVAPVRHGCMNNLPCNSDSADIVFEIQRPLARSQRMAALADRLRLLRPGGLYILALEGLELSDHENKTALVHVKIPQGDFELHALQDELAELETSRTVQNPAAATIISFRRSS